MESFLPLRVKGRFGLNTRRRDDALDPGQATVSKGVDLSRLTLAKRKGSRPMLLGSADNVLKGPAAGQSLYVTGEEHWLEHDSVWLGALGDDTNPTFPNLEQRRESPHHRQGVIVLPEGDVPELRLEVKTGGASKDWAIEFSIWTDDLPFHQAHGPILPTSINIDTILAAKGRGSTYQWALRIIPDGTSVNRRYICLTLYEASALASGTDFYYQAGAARSWIEPNKKIRIAFQFDDTAATITTKYWIEGSTAVSSSQAVGGTLRTNGVLHATTNATPIVFGRRARLQNLDVPATDKREMGSCWCPGDFLFWCEDALAPTGTLTMPSNWMTVASIPPSSSDWYVDREIPVEQLSTVDSGTLIQTTDLRLYFQFKPELLGTSPTGTETGDGGHIIRPRYKSGGGTEPRAWVTGADAIWVPMAANSKLGDYALAFIPGGPTGQKFEYADTVRYALAHYSGYRLFCAGIRVPNGNSYLRKLTESATSTSYEYADAYSFDGTFIVDALPALGSGDFMVLLEICAVRQGPVTLADYAVEPVMQIAIAESGGAWKLRFLVKNGVGTETSIFSTTTIVEGTEYTFGAAVRWDLINAFVNPTRTMALYLDGPQEASNVTPVSSKPYLSQVSNAEDAGVGALTTDTNSDTRDGRDSCYPMSIGYTCRTAQAGYATPAVPFSTRFGSQQQGVSDNLGNRAYWAFHNNFTPKTPNDGVTYHGERGFAGRIGRINIWKDKFLSEDEHRRWVSRAPTEKEIASFGGKLVSSWNMEEGHGCFVRDRGALGNDLRFSNVPSVRVQTGALKRVERPPLLGVWQLRKDGLNDEQRPDRETYGLAGGCVHRFMRDASGEIYLESIGRVLTHELYTPRARALRLPTAFDFQGSLFICPGLGPVKRITDGVLSDAGVNPVYGNPGDDQTNQGWREFDRDGTFHVLGADETAPPATVTFAEGGLYSWYVTHVDPRTGLESAPSRLMTYRCTNRFASPGNGWYACYLQCLPRPFQRHVTKMRIYRTTKDGDPIRAKFVAEIDVANDYLDTTTDDRLGSAIDSFLNFPPPKDVNVGVTFGSRAFYTGDPSNPRRVWYSRNGLPGAVPPQYFFDLPEPVTALLPSNGVLLACSQRRVWAVRDSGAEVTFGGNEPPPVSVEPLRSDVGCIGQHATALIDRIGWCFASLRGLYLTDGYNFRFVSADIEPTYRRLDFSVSHVFTMAHDRARQRVILSCSTQSSPDDRNDTALAWYYAGLKPETQDEVGRDGFSLWENFGFVAAATLEDDVTGDERTMLCDYSGQMFEYDPPDADVNNDGVASGPTSGTIRDRKLDPLGSGKYTRLQLVTDSTLPTAGAGLRGVRLYTSDANKVAWYSQPLIVLENDANWVTVESAGAAATDPTGYEWRLGAIGYEWKAGKDSLGSETLVKEVTFVSVKFGHESGAPPPGCTMNIDVGYDELTPDTGLLDPAKKEDEFAAVDGRGRRVQVRFYDTDLPGGRPDNPIEIQEYELAYWVEGKSSYVGDAT